MPRVKRGTIKTHKRTKLLKLAKGYRYGGHKKERAAKERLLHAFPHAYRGRKQEKRDMRSLWQMRLNAAVREQGLTYSTFMSKLKKKGIILNRKVLSELAVKHPQVFSEIIKAVK